jgi:transcriptional regulator with XRE-family HTH domain
MRLRELMDDRGWNTSRVIHFAFEGEVSPKTVERWLAGTNAPSAENLVRLADAFEVSVDYLVGRSDWDGRDRREREEWEEKERARRVAPAEVPPAVHRPPRPPRKRRTG